MIKKSYLKKIRKNLKLNNNPKITLFDPKIDHPFNFYVLLKFGPFFTAIMVYLNLLYMLEADLLYN